MLNPFVEQDRLSNREYRYSTAGYYSLSDAVNERRRWHNGLYENDYWPSDEDESWQASDPNTITRLVL